jgi:hypothetical protein
MLGLILTAEALFGPFRLPDSPRLEQIGYPVLRYIDRITGLKWRRDQDAITDHRHLVGETILQRTIRVKERCGQCSGCSIKEIGRAEKGIAPDVPKRSDEHVVARDR